MDKGVEIKIQVVGAEQAQRSLDAVSNTVRKTSGSIFGDVLKANLAFEAIKKGIELTVGALQTFVQIGSSVVRQAFDMASGLEQSKIAFDTMLGSGKKASEFLVDLEKFALKTPFNLSELQDASKRLLAYGFSAKKVIPTIRNLGNISAGVGRDKLPLLILALGQVRAAGKLTGAELRQFTEAGVPLLEELARVTKKTTARVKDDMERGIAPSFAQVEQALANLSGEGGRFNNLMERQSKSVAGVLSNMEDYRDKVLRLIGGINSAGEITEGGLLDTVAKELQNVLKWIDQNEMEIRDFATAISQDLTNAIKIAKGFLGGFASNLADIDINFGSLGKSISSLLETLGVKLPATQKEFEAFAKSLGEKASKSLNDFLIKANELVVNLNKPETKASFDKTIGAMGAVANMAGMAAGAIGWLGKKMDELTRGTGRNFILGMLDTRTHLIALNLALSGKNPFAAYAKSWEQANKIVSNGFRSSSKFIIGRINEAIYYVNGAIAAWNRLTGMKVGSVKKASMGLVQRGAGGGGGGSFASGGIVPGNSYSGDKVISRTNSGEMILNKSQQSVLFRLLSQRQAPVQNINANFGQSQASPMQQMNSFSNLLIQSAR